MGDAEVGRWLDGTDARPLDVAVLGLRLGPLAGTITANRNLPLGSHLFSEILGISDNLLDLLNHSPRPQNTTDDTVTEGDQSHDTDD